MEILEKKFIFEAWECPHKNIPASTLNGVGILKVIPKKVIAMHTFSPEIQGGCNVSSKQTRISKEKYSFNVILVPKIGLQIHHAVIN